MPEPRNIEEHSAASTAEQIANDDNKSGSGSPPEPQDIEKQPAAAALEGHWITGIKLFIMMASVTLVFFLMLLDISILSTATPKITSDFHSLQNVGWYGAAYQLASATLQPLTGKVYSNFSTKWTFFVFFLIFELGSLLCGVSTSSNMLIVSRAVAGMGASGLANGALTIIAVSVPMRKRPSMMGVMIGCSQLGLVGGPLFGGLLTQYVSWRWCFYINLPFGGAVAALLLFLHVPEQVVKPPPMTVVRDLHNKLDLVGFAIFTPAAIMLLLAVQYGGNQYPWDSATVIGLFCGAGATFLLWVAWDCRKGAAAMIPLPSLKKQHVWSSCLIMAFLGSAMFMTSYYLPIYFQGVRNKSPAISGVYLLPSILSQIVGAVISGKGVEILGYYMPFSFASAVLTALGYGLISTLRPHTSTGKWVGYQILFGLGRGLGLQMGLVAVQHTLPPAQIPTATAMIMFSQTFGGALFLSFADTVFTNSLRELIRQNAPSVDVQAVVNAGAYAFRDVVPKEALADVLVAYAGSIDRVFYMCASLAGACFVLSFATGWVDIRKDAKGRTPS